jgi:hypothetical protein
VTFLPIPEKNIPFPEGMFLEERRDVPAVVGPQRPEQGNLLQEDFRMGHVLPSQPHGAFSFSIALRSSPKSWTTGASITVV